MTIKHIGFLAVFCSVSAQEDGGYFDRLSRAREAFGDAAANRSDDLFSFNGIFDGRAGEIIFPEGRADQRFYINGVRLPGTGAAMGRKGVVLQFETKRNGRVTAEWMVELETFPGQAGGLPPAAMKSAGTMVRYLWREGLRFKDPLSKTVATRVSEREGYAVYSLRFSPPPSEKFWYWFIGKNGIPVKYHYFDLPGIDPDRLRLPGSGDSGKPDEMYLPRLGRPYPISPEERRSVNSSSRRGRR